MNDIAKPERLQAAERGDVSYRGGRECRYGHAPIRWVSTGGCVQCTKDRAARQREVLKAAIARGRAAAEAAS